MIWPHGQKTLKDFLQHLNGIHGNFIHQGTWTKRNITIFRWPGKKKDGWHTGPHGIQEKPQTQTYFYMRTWSIIWNKNSSPLNSHPPCTIYLWWRQSIGWTIYDKDSLQDEPFVMKTVYRMNHLDWRQPTGWTICDEDGLQDEPFVMKIVYRMNHLWR